MRLSILSQPLSYTLLRLHQDQASFGVPDDPTEITQSSHLMSRLKSSVAHWGHPVLLPILLLQNCMSRSNLFAWNLDDQVVVLERQTGVVFAGRTALPNEGNIDPENIPRNKIRTLTRDMHSLLTEIIFFKRVITWMADCARFLEKSVREIGPGEVGYQDENSLRRENREILEMLESIGADARSLSGLQKSLKERVQSQINVVRRLTHTFSGTEQ
jgi:hypothetical protein